MIIGDQEIIITGVEIVGGEEALRKAIKASMNKDDRFKSCEIVIDCPYAVYVEYGTHAAKNKSQSKTNPVWMRFMRWALLKPKFVTLPINERKKLAYGTYVRVMREGLPEHPFIRPALKEMAQSVNRYEYFSHGGSIKNYAEAVANRMKKILEDDDRYYTHHLIDSIYVREIGDHGTTEQTTLDEFDYSELNEEANSK